MTYCGTCNETLADGLHHVCAHCGTPRPATGWPADPRLHTTLAGHQYRALRRIGAGGFGTVYEVETMVGGLRRALKVLHAEHARDESTRRRFINEAVVLEQLNHPNVARCYAAGVLDGGDEVYLLLELVNGVPLSDLLTAADGARPRVEPLRAVRLARQIASGLVAVHATGVLHRDLTPRNVLVIGADNPDERVKLVDFGIAGALDGVTMSAETLVGTPRFMPPELFVPGTELDGRCDLWQLGALLHLMLTGTPPGHDSPSGQIQDPALDELTRRLLAINRDDRPATAADVCDALARIEHTMLALDQTDDALALLEALCAKPGEEAWIAVCRFLMGRTDSPDLVTHAQRLLEPWPAHLRQAPVQWWQAVKRHGGHPLWALARALDLSGHALDDGDVRTLATQPALATMTCLRLADNHIGNAGVQALASSPYLTGLRTLDLSDNRIGSEGGAALPGTMRQLEVLRMAGNGLGARGAEAIATAEWSLRSLDLGGNDIRTAGAEAIASSPSLRTLRQLSLADNAIGSDGASAIAMSRALTGLRALDLSNNRIGPGGGAALALAPNLGALSSLSLAQNTLGLEGVGLLLSSHRFSSIETLDLSSNDIGPQGAMALSSSPTARRLKRLELADNRLGDAGLAALLGAPFLSGLRTLGVAQNGITAGGVALLGGAASEVEALDLSRNPLRRDGLEALTRELSRLRLRSLLLADCELPGHAVPLILEAAPATLTHVSVAGNALGPACRPASVSAWRCQLVQLDVSRNAFDGGTLAGLLQLPALAGLQALTAGSNELGGETGGQLVAALAGLPALVRLSGRDAGLGTASVAALAASPLAGRLQALDLAMNGLDDAAVTALARPPGFHALRTLVLERNPISFASASSILSSPAMPLLQSVSFARSALKNVIDLHSLARRKVDLLEASFACVTADGAHLAERFYARLFERYPATKPLFAHTPMRRQQQHLTSALTMVIEHLRAPDMVAPQLAAMAQRHVGYGVYPSHYQAVVTAMLDTLKEVLAEAWTAELEDAWHDGLEAIAGTMMRAQQRGTPSERAPARAGQPVIAGVSPR
jgi:serine/threonine protein kinase/hemoglobin-like flavoprotein/Ran GTPase-activating protein (RanGAP) involved in mRNA processing and transport